MEIEQILKIIQILRNKSKKKSARNKISFCASLVKWEERIWTFTVFFSVIAVTFLYLSGQAFVLEDELTVYQHSQRIAVDWIKETIGIFRDDYPADEMPGLKALKQKEINPAKLVALERKLDTKRYKEIDELLSMDKCTIATKQRIKQLKSQRSLNAQILEPPNADKCRNIHELTEFRTCFNTDILSRPHTSSCSATYSLWIKESFGALLDEIALKLRTALVNQAKLMKKQLTVRSAQTTVSTIKSLLTTAIADADSIPTAGIEVEPANVPVSAKRSDDLTSFYNKHR